MTLLTVQDLDNFDTVVNHAQRDGGTLKLSYSHKTWTLSMTYAPGDIGWTMHHETLTGTLQMAADQILETRPKDTIDNAVRLPAMHVLGTLTGRIPAKPRNEGPGHTAFPHPALEDQGYPTVGMTGTDALLHKAQRVDTEVLRQQVGLYALGMKLSTHPSDEPEPSDIGTDMHAAMESFVDNEVTQSEQYGLGAKDFDRDMKPEDN